MRALVWNCPWGSQGQPLFFFNCLKDHLVLQANTLQSIGIETFIALADYQRDAIKNLSGDVTATILSARSLNIIVGKGDPLERLHADWNGPLTHALVEHLRPLLPKNIDIIITWENPTPYLEQIYPEAVFINQMPGAFSRPPYPKTVTIDFKGLYSRSFLASALPDQLQNSLSPLERSIAQEFSRKARDAINILQPFDRAQIFDADIETWLLPLQVGAHYAFKTDSGMGSSSEFLTRVLDHAPESAAVAITQYRSSFTADAPINEKNFALLKSRWPQLVWTPDFERIPSPSHFILPLADRLVTHSSSILFQAMAWNKPVQVLSGSYFDKFSAQSSEELTRNREVLAFLLGRYNVLNESITKDAKFLSRLLDVAIGLRTNGVIKASDLPSFHNIDPSYDTKLLDAFDGSAITKALTRVNPSITEREKIAMEFRSVIARDATKIVSFDIFDTLITRPVEIPVALFYMVQTAAERDLGIQLADFPRIRSWAEKRAREESAEEEIRIENIYQHIIEYYLLSAEDAAKLISCEIEIEIQASLPRSMGKRLWSLAMASGKRIILISDMYLPKTAIEKMLCKCGYSGYKEIFVSSDFASTKRTGKLYDHVLTKLGIGGHSIFHIGDNKNADCTNAEARNFRTMYIPKALDRMRKNEIYNQIFPPRYGSERARATISGLIAYRFFEGIPMPGESTTLFANELWRLGYAALGPLYVGFSQWLHREAKRDSITKLYFLAREGHLLREIYTSLMGQNALPNEYILCSRRAARVAALQTPRQVAALAGEAFAESSRFSSLIKSRFGLDIRTLSSERISELQFDIDDALETTPEGKSKFARACALLAPEILNRAACERKAYLRYLHDAGFQNEEKPAVVDLGWKGNMQTALSSLRSGEVFGYYLATLAGVESNSTLHGHMRGYAGERLSAGFPDVILANRKILEVLTCHTDLSFSHFSIGSSGSLHPEFLEDSKHVYNARIISEIHRGAKLFAEDYCRSFSGADQEALIDYTLVSRVLKSFLTNPTKEDVLLVAALSFEDEFAGATAATMQETGSKVWPAGAAILAQQNMAARAIQALMPKTPSVPLSVASPPARTPFSEMANQNKRGGTTEKKATSWIVRLENRIVHRLASVVS